MATKTEQRYTSIPPDTSAIEQAFADLRHKQEESNQLLREGADMIEQLQATGSEQASHIAELEGELEAARGQAAAMSSLSSLVEELRDATARYAECIATDPTKSLRELRRQNEIDLAEIRAYVGDGSGEARSAVARVARVGAILVLGGSKASALKEQYLRDRGWKRQPGGWAEPGESMDDLWPMSVAFSRQAANDADGFIGLARGEPQESASRADVVENDLVPPDDQGLDGDNDRDDAEVVAGGPGSDPLETGDWDDDIDDANEEAAAVKAEQDAIAAKERAERSRSQAFTSLEADRAKDALLSTKDDDGKPIFEDVRVEELAAKKFPFVGKWTDKRKAETLAQVGGVARKEDVEAEIERRVAERLEKARRPLAVAGKDRVRLNQAETDHVRSLRDKPDANAVLHRLRSKPATAAPPLVSNEEEQAFRRKRAEIAARAGGIDGELQQLPDGRWAKVMLPAKLIANADGSPPSGKNDHRFARPLSEVSE